jgi:hypothetical protein
MRPSVLGVPRPLISAAIAICLLAPALSGPAWAATGVAPSGTASGNLNLSAPLLAQSSPSPSPSATPRFTYSGYGRSYDFTRLNNPQISKSNPLNQQSWTTAASLHGAYNLGGGFSLGASYLYAFPFSGACNSALTHAGPPCENPNLQIPGQGTNPDDTLPGFIMNTLYETYLQFQDPKLYVKLGDQVINTPWANAADTRLKPVAFRGGDASYSISSDWSVEVMDMTDFEGRSESNFTNSTLLTATKIASANYGGMPSNFDQPAYTAVPTDGFTFGRVGFASGPFGANGYFYDFADIAQAYWLEEKYVLPSRNATTLSLQMGDEQNTGRSVLGKIDSQVWGLQGSISPSSELNFQLGFDVIPDKSTTMTLPTGVTCSSKGQISAKVPFEYFLPSGGTPQCQSIGNGTTAVFYGGWVSPYTDGYTADPLYSTTITTSMVDRSSPGESVQLQATGYAMQNRIRLIARQGYYLFGNPMAGMANTQEFDADGTFFFNKVRTGTYKGLSFRYRYANRTQHEFTSNPDFKYNRAQLEYDF